MSVLIASANKPDPKFFDNSIDSFLTLGELALRLQISVSGLRKIVARDTKFPKYKVGQQLRFRWSSVERHFQRGDV